MKNFRTYLEQKNISPATIKKYSRNIDLFKNFIHKELEYVTKKDILQYLHFLQDKKQLANSTRQKHVGILKHYYHYLVQKKEVTNNPVLLINMRGTRKKILYNILNINQLNDFIDLHYNTYKKQIRNNLLLTFYVYQGLKKSEWETLTIGDIDLVKGTIHIQATKKTNARKLILQPLQLGLLYTYLQDRKDSEEKLFTTKPELQKWCIKLKKLYPLFTHFLQLRTSIITYWIQTEGLRKAQYKAGHRYISSTESYLANDLETLKENIERYHPL